MLDLTFTTSPSNAGLWTECMSYKQVGLFWWYLFQLQKLKKCIKELKKKNLAEIPQLHGPNSVERSAAKIKQS